MRPDSTATAANTSVDATTIHRVTRKLANASAAKAGPAMIAVNHAPRASMVLVAKRDARM